MQSPAYDAWYLIKVQCMFIIAIILELHSFYTILQVAFSYFLIASFAVQMLVSLIRSYLFIALGD